MSSATLFAARFLRYMITMVVMMIKAPIEVVTPIRIFLLVSSSGVSSDEWMGMSVEVAVRRPNSERLEPKIPLE